MLENLAQIELEDNNQLKPKVFFADSVISQASESWRDALIVKLLGKSLGFSMMKAKLANTWNLRAGFDIMSAGNGYFMVKFDLLEDKAWVMEGGLWMIQGHYLATKQWMA